MNAQQRKFLCPVKIGPYQLQNTVGRGAFGTVKVAYRPDNGKYFACKIITKHTIDSMIDKSKFEKEIRIMQQLHSPRIVQLFDLLKDTMNYYIVTELCTGGDMFQQILRNKKIPEERAKIYVKQLLEAISYIHKLNVCHRDLKPENILLDNNGDIKLSDFGFSKFTDGLTHTSCGSYVYAAPEILDGADYDPKKSDIWAVGVIIYAMVTGQLPWTKRNQHELSKQIKSCQYKIPQDVSEECLSIITSILQKEPEDRPTADELLTRPWFCNIVTMPPSQILPIISLKKVDEFFELEQSTLEIPSVEKKVSSRCLKDFDQADRTICRKPSSDHLSVKSCLSMSQSEFKAIRYVDPKASSDILDMRQYHLRSSKKRLFKPALRSIPSSLI